MVYYAYVSIGPRWTRNWRVLMFRYIAIALSLITFTGVAHAQRVNTDGCVEQTILNKQVLKCPDGMYQWEQGRNGRLALVKIQVYADPENADDARDRSEARRQPYQPSFGGGGGYRQPAYSSYGYYGRINCYIVANRWLDTCIAERRARDEQRIRDRDHCNGRSGYRYTRTPGCNPALRRD